jgi:pyruvate ferredoxin oxidoreductase alpha subunit
MGSFGETAAEAVELMRSQGRKVGLLKLRLWRPFPFKELCRAVKGARRLIVLDRAVSYGGPGGPVAAEIRSALYNLGNKPQIYNYIVGLGGRDVDVRDYLQIYETAEQSSEYQIYGARE